MPLTLPGDLGPCFPLVYQDTHCSQLEKAKMAGFSLGKPPCSFIAGAKTMQAPCSPAPSHTPLVVYNPPMLSSRSGRKHCTGKTPRGSEGNGSTCEHQGVSWAVSPPQCEATAMAPLIVKRARHCRSTTLSLTEREVLQNKNAIKEWTSGKRRDWEAVEAKVFA